MNAATFPRSSSDDMIPRSAAQLCLIRGAGCLGRSIFFAGVFSLEIVGDRIDNQLLQSEGGALRRLSADEGIVQKGQPDYGVRRGHPNGAVERLNKALECADPPGAPVLDPDGSFTPGGDVFFLNLDRSTEQLLAREWPWRMQPIFLDRMDAGVSVSPGRPTRLSWG